MNETLTRRNKLSIAFMAFEIHGIVADMLTPTEEMIERDEQERSQ